MVILISSRIKYYMELYFKNSNVEKLCTDGKYAIKKLGPEVGKKLGYLIVNLSQAHSLIDVYKMSQYRMHKLKGDRINQYSLTITKSSPYRVIIYPLDENKNILKSNQNEKQMLINTLCIEIVEVKDYHD